MHTQLWVSWGVLSRQGIAMDFKGLSRIGLGFGFVRELKAKLNFTQRERDFN